MIIKTPKGNKAKVTYSFDGIPMDDMGLMPLYVGYTLKNKVIIQPHLEHDKGLLAHELCHVDQWNDYWCFSFRYNYKKEFRLKMEAEAFAAQLNGNEDLEKLQNYANELSTKYNLDSSADICANLIMKFYGGKK